MKYILFKDGCGFARYNPDDGSVSHTLNYDEATEACLSDWSDVLAFDFGDYRFDFGDYRQIVRAADAVVENIEIGKRWRENSSLEEWFPFSAQKLKALEAECGNAAAIILKQNAEINRLRAQIEQPNDQAQRPVPGTGVERVVMRNRYRFQEHRIKPSFQWCEKCVGAEGCYPEGCGPNYLEPACWKGPMTSAEVSHNISS